jgi:hypothetical protein
MMMVVPSITTLQGQLEADAVGMGLTVLNLNKVRTCNLLGNFHSFGP